jgi:four helix bundle protein
MSSQTRTKQLGSARDLIVYKSAYGLAMEIFEWSKHFPAKEKYALTSQIRRSSRSILNLREGWAKRRYEAHFVSKITDCDAENSETDFVARFRKSLWLHLYRTTQDAYSDFSGDWPDVGCNVEKGRFISDF